MSTKEPICLRPHHLLCTQGYGGKGYSSEFVARMTEVTDRLRSDPDIEVEIVFSTDDLCGACPSKRGEGLCADAHKVLRYDAGVREVLGLKEGCYAYHALIERLDAALTEEKLAQICGDCSWYPVSACRANILGKRYVLTTAAVQDSCHDEDDCCNSQ